ncbi:MAG TPA: hypothetical protein PKH02_13115 [Bacteroidales bacterium]|nr:hypothetical protein [Bacteroidales bacterium]
MKMVQGSPEECRYFLILVPDLKYRGSIGFKDKSEAVSPDSYRDWQLICKPF